MSRVFTFWKFVHGAFHCLLNFCWGPRNVITRVYRINKWIKLKKEKFSKYKADFNIQVDEFLYKSSRFSFGIDCLSVRIIFSLIGSFIISWYWAKREWLKIPRLVQTLTDTYDAASHTKVSSYMSPASHVNFFNNLTLYLIKVFCVVVAVWHQ